MKIIVLAADEQWQELTNTSSQINWERVADNTAFISAGNADAFFYLADEEFLPDISNIKAPVFINAVNKTLKELNAAPNVYRINAWQGFLSHPVWEIAGLTDEKINAIFTILGKKISFVNDEPGFIAARIIAMIINEAYFALGDKVSSKAEIDTAMKLGTNYPYGPFEWAEKIGVKNVFELLQKLTAADNRYQPAPLLAEEAKENKP